jgi:hypothetical protein
MDYIFDRLFRIQEINLIQIDKKRGPVASILGPCNVGINHHDAHSINAEKYSGMIES